VLIRNLYKNSRQQLKKRDRRKINSCSWYPFNSQTAAWQRGCHRKYSRQPVCFYLSNVRVVHELDEYAKAWKTNAAKVFFCHSRNLWDIFRRELCWLVKDLREQRGDKTNTCHPHTILPLCTRLFHFYLSPSLPLCLLAGGQRDEVSGYCISDMALGQGAAISTSSAYGWHQPAWLMCNCFQPSSWHSEKSLQLKGEM